MGSSIEDTKALFKPLVFSLSWFISDSFVSLLTGYFSFSAFQNSKLFFAGEATHYKYAGTMHGAYASGRLAAGKMYDALQLYNWTTKRCTFFFARYQSYNQKPWQTHRNSIAVHLLWKKQTNIPLNSQLAEARLFLTHLNSAIECVSWNVQIKSYQSLARFASPRSKTKATCSQLVDEAGVGLLAAEYLGKVDKEQLALAEVQARQQWFWSLCEFPTSVGLGWFQTSGKFKLSPDLKPRCLPGSFVLCPHCRL